MVKTQSLISQSPGEAELYGVVRGSCEALGLQSLYGDFGVSPNPTAKRGKKSHYARLKSHYNTDNLNMMDTMQ